ncbi:MAG: cutinase family protein [Corynebacterium sp.]|nr:cutinase family protein [Corynebacterium sp.]
MRRARKSATVVATLVVLALIVWGVVQWISGSNNGGQETTSAQPTDVVQPEWCPAVEFISIPGTWESSATDDPVNPTFNPLSFMLSITGPLQDRYSPDDVKVFTVPYTAEFKNVQDLGQMSYDKSREEGYDTTLAEITATHAECPLTEYVVAGFSQGAVIAGDLASEIGNSRTAIDPQLVAGVTVIADGRREAGVGQSVGNPVSGVGAEIALHSVNAVIQVVVPGATMRGTRAGGFGVLNDRVMDICAPDDSICDAPLDVGNALDRAKALIGANGVHALYASNPNVIPGTTADQWTVGWAEELIDARI